MYCRLCLLCQLCLLCLPLAWRSMHVARKKPSCTPLSWCGRFCWHQYPRRISRTWRLQQNDLCRGSPQKCPERDENFQIWRHRTLRTAKDCGISVQQAEHNIKRYMPQHVLVLSLNPAQSYRAKLVINQSKVCQVSLRRTIGLALESSWALILPFCSI